MKAGCKVRGTSPAGWGAGELHRHREQASLLESVRSLSVTGGKQREASLAGQLSAFSGTLDSARMKLFLAWTPHTPDSAQTQAAQNVVLPEAQVLRC